MKSAFLAACFVWVGAVFPAFASSFEPVALEPIEHQAAQVVIVRPDGTEFAYSPAELEEFSTFRVRTTTPWREEPADFEGILLSELMEANGLQDAGAILVTAENDFTSTVPNDIWDEILVVTRVDGRAHSRRTRGPIQFVMESGTYNASATAREEHLVWMAARIEALD
ncbi:MAG: hypothetical protein AAGP08_08555 [Pseudomonadota bacterium]